MAYAGEILENPVSGVRTVFRKTASETSGELLAFELLPAPAPTSTHGRRSASRW